MRIFYPLLAIAISLPFIAFADDEVSALEKPAEIVPPGYVFDVTVKSAQELNVILNRADSLRKLFDPEQHGRISIVLHGDELQLFQKDNYSANQSIVERARLLDEAKVIDIKACQTQMRFLKIDPSELPEFIEQVPFAPAEIERLNKSYGFTRL